MMEWQISDQDIQAAEELLLPHGAHFPEDARNVIRCWHSTDVAACPGSGKTTVLLAKLKLLADRMPLENGAGICVLSHTNVAVNEIKNRLSDYADRLLSYPNYIGTILFIHCQKEQRQHDDHHGQCSKAHISGCFHQKENRHSDECRRTKAK